MKRIFCALIQLVLLFTIPAYATNLCVGMAKSKYCLGKPPSNKAAYSEAATLDGGIDIQTRKNRRSRYNYGNEVESVTGLSIATTLDIQDGKVVGVHQLYRIDAKDNQSKSRFYSLLEQRLSRQYGKPTARTKLDKFKYAEWVSQSLEIYITDIEEEYVSVNFSIPSRH